jgi:hypothetical protein
MIYFNILYCKAFHVNSHKLIFLRKIMKYQNIEHNYRNRIFSVF